MIVPHANNALLSVYACDSAIDQETEKLREATYKRACDRYTRKG